MRRVSRWIQKYFGPAAPHVAVRAEMPWYWRMALAAILVAIGYAAASLRYIGGNAGNLREKVMQLEQENQSLHTQAIHVERQQQVTNVAQTDLAKDLTALQEENVRLKEDVTFYKSILEESAGVAVVKLHSFKVSRGARASEYQYRLLLIQSGKHDRNVQGSLQLTVIGTQDGKPATQVVLGGKSPSGGKVNFKYYQPLEGSFTLPAQMTAESLQAKFFQIGSAEPKLTQVVSLTN
jgi:hypothetical protein